jgi:FAD/FMN-containing dehydrogenase
MKPGCIVTPKSTKDVASVIKVLTARKTKFAIRSGGHTSIPGFSGVGSDGVLVALQNLNKLAVSKDRKIATVGPGNRWGAVYQFLARYGLTVVGGRLPDVGVGGFLLGGCILCMFGFYHHITDTSLNRWLGLLLQSIWVRCRSNNKIQGELWSTH